jgi:hypothetical protein
MAAVSRIAPNVVRRDARTSGTALPRRATLQIRAGSAALDKIGYQE